METEVKNVFKLPVFVETDTRNPRSRAAWQDIQTIMDRYIAGEHCPAIGRDYHIAARTVQTMLKKNGVRLRPHSEWTQHKVNKDYFSKIDTAEKAQILGFIYADGCVSENGDSWKLSITVHEQDAIYLDNLRKALGYSGPMWKVKPKKSIHHVLCIHGKKMGLDLIALGATPRKTFTLDFPTTEQVPVEFMTDFVRGFMEGDGSIHIKNDKKHGYKYLRVSFRGPELFLSKLKIFQSSQGIYTSLYMDAGRIGQLCVIRKPDVSAFLKLIYCNRPIPFLMERKYQKALPNLTQS